jgi:hypothetical protein
MLPDRNPPLRKRGIQEPKSDSAPDAEIGPEGPVPALGRDAMFDRFDSER